jgi:hypothetical protein
MDQTPERFRTPHLELYAMGGQVVIAYAPAEQRSWTMTAAEAKSLRHLGVFRTLEEHARALTLPGGARALHEHVRQRLLVPEAEVRARLTGARRFTRTEARREKCAADRNQGDDLQTAVFITRDRPAPLARAIGSAMDNAAAHRRQLEASIIDDSRAPAARAANLAWATAEATRGRTVRHDGFTDRVEFSRRIARSAGVDEAVVRFALLGDERCPLGTGAARNCALLSHVGRRFLLCDDDVSWVSAAPPRRQAGLALSAEFDPTRIWFFRDHAELLAGAEWEPRDLLGAHAALLGRSLREIATGGSATDLDCSGLDARFEERLPRGVIRVRVTMAGVAGDSGLGHPDYLGFDPESLARATVSETFHHEVWQSRQMLRSSLRPTLTRPGALVAMQIGLDATRMLPPFVPVQRNSDGNFARVLRLCFPAALVGHLDLCLLHQPPEARRDSAEGWRASRMRLRFPDLVASVLEGWSPGPRAGLLPAGSALRMLGRDLVSLTEDSLAAFEERVRRAIWASEARQARALDARSVGAPPFLAARIAEAQALRQQAVSSPLYIVPRDLERDGDLPAARSLSRELFRSLGRLLCAWPRIWRSATSARRELTGQEVATQ